MAAAPPMPAGIALAACTRTSTPGSNPGHRTRHNAPSSTEWLRPVTGRPFTRGTAMPVTDSASHRPSRRVLVVDDNEDAAESLAALLRIFGHEVGVAFDGEQALAVAPELKPDLVLLDLGMPRMDGHEVARRMRAAPWGAAIKIVALSGFGDSSDRDAVARSRVQRPPRQARLADSNSRPSSPTPELGRSAGRRVRPAAPAARAGAPGDRQPTSKWCLTVCATRSGSGPSYASRKYVRASHSARSQVAATSGPARPPWTERETRCRRAIRVASILQTVRMSSAARRYCRALSCRKLRRVSISVTCASCIAPWLFSRHASRSCCNSTEDGWSSSDGSSNNSDVSSCMLPACLLWVDVHGGAAVGVPVGTRLARA